MKVLHIINDLGLGGAQKLIEETLPQINKTVGAEVEVLLLTDKGNVFSKGLMESGIRINVISLRKPRSLLNIFYIRRHIVNGKYNIVHAHLFPTLYWVSAASRLILRNKPKFFYTEHSTNNRRRGKTLLRFFEQLIYSSFDGIISISDSTQENLIQWIKPSQSSNGKFTVINNGINMNKIREAEPYEKVEIDSEFNSGIKLLCMVGRFSAAKDQATAIRAMKSFTENVHLLLVGDGSLRKKYEKLAADIGVSNRVHFLGFRDDVGRILKTSDIVIQSSNWEGFGMAALEGMAAGKPVVASNVSGVREIIKGAGILFEKGNSRELANEISSLLNDSRRYREVAAACLSRAELFDMETMIKKTLTEYEKALSESTVLVSRN